MGGGGGRVQAGVRSPVFSLTVARASLGAKNAAAFSGRSFLCVSLDVSRSFPLCNLFIQTAVSPTQKRSSQTLRLPRGFCLVLHCFV